MYQGLRIANFPENFVNVLNEWSNSKLASHLHYKTDSRLLTVNFSIDDIAKLLQNLEPNKAHGHNKISIPMLTLCGNSICKPLEFVFKQSMEKGSLPSK